MVGDWACRAVAVGTPGPRLLVHVSAAPRRLRRAQVDDERAEREAEPHDEDEDAVGLEPPRPTGLRGQLVPDEDGHGG